MEDDDDTTTETAVPPAAPQTVPAITPEAFFNRELSWLAFARRVLAMVEDPELELLERVKFLGIMGLLHYEFFTKRASGLKRQMKNKPTKASVDGLVPRQEFDLCRMEVVRQMEALSRVLENEILPGLESAGIPIFRYDRLSAPQKRWLRDYFRESVQPILIPLAVDAEHPFPFISNLGLNLAVMVPDANTKKERFVRIKVPVNRPRWVALPGKAGFVPLEQVIEANIAAVFPGSPPKAVCSFRVTRGAEGDQQLSGDLAEADASEEPGSIVRQVSTELKARKFAGVVRLQVEARMPASLRKWLAEQLKIGPEDVYETHTLLGLSDFLAFRPEAAAHFSYPQHQPLTHPRLRGLDVEEPGAIFDEIARGDILLHHPYHSFDTSVLRFLESAARDPKVLGIQLTIYRTSSDSPIVAALAEAARRGKQVAVLVEITARFDEAPNIAWGALLEKEGVHVAYGVEHLKTHVKLALVVREERGKARRYLHVGTGNYHTGTAKIYEDLGILTCDSEICEDAAQVFAALTGATPLAGFNCMLVAPVTLRKRFVELIRREADHARSGRPSGIRAKMNQLQDLEIIRELYEASHAGVLRPGVPGLSENIRVYGIIGRYLEHSRVYRFENGGSPEFFTGSADWMRRNLDRRVETIIPVKDPVVRQELMRVIEVYESDNASAWDCRPDGTYVRRRPAPGEERRAAQELFPRELRLARQSPPES
jgi:polyphosphate kinase